MPRKATPRPEINPLFVMPARADGSAFWVPSRSKDICYLVERRNGALSCSCPARIARCCHVRAVEARLLLDAETDVLVSLPRELAHVSQSEAQKLAQAVAPVASQDFGIFCNACQEIHFTGERCTFLVQLDMAAQHLESAERTYAQDDQRLVNLRNAYDRAVERATGAQEQMEVPLCWVCHERQVKRDGLCAPCWQQNEHDQEYQKRMVKKTSTAKVTKGPGPMMSFACPRETVSEQAARSARYNASVLVDATPETWSIFR